MKTEVEFIANGSINSPKTFSLRVRWYQPVSIAEVLRLCEHVAVLGYMDIVDLFQVKIAQVLTICYTWNMNVYYRSHKSL